MCQQPGKSLNFKQSLIGSGFWAWTSVWFSILFDVIQSCSVSQTWKVDTHPRRQHATRQGRSWSSNSQLPPFFVCKKKNSRTRMIKKFYPEYYLKSITNECLKYLRVFLGSTGKNSDQLVMSDVVG
jgi:hypothetical protein